MMGPHGKAKGGRFKVLGVVQRLSIISSKSLSVAANLTPIPSGTRQTIWPVILIGSLLLETDNVVVISCPTAKGLSVWINIPPALMFCMSPLKAPSQLVYSTAREHVFLGCRLRSGPDRVFNKSKRRHWFNKLRSVSCSSAEALSTKRPISLTILCSCALTLGSSG